MTLRPLCDLASFQCFPKLTSKTMLEIYILDTFLIQIYFQSIRSFGNNFLMTVIPIFHKRV